MCWTKLELAVERPSRRSFIRWMRPRGESVSCPHRRYVGHVGRQKPQCTQSSSRSRVDEMGCVELTFAGIICLSTQRYIEARRLAGAHIDIHREGLKPVLLDADAMRSFVELDNQAILPLRSSP